MSKDIAFLRAINVGGHRVTMERLRELFAAAGLTGVETFIASGNVIFDDPGEPADELERRIEAELGVALGYEVATFLRRPGELGAAIGACPFDASAAATAGHNLSLGFTRGAMSADAASALAALGDAGNTLQAAGREFWWLRTTGIRETKVTGAAIERALGRRPVTVRNITTAQSLVARYG